MKSFQLGISLIALAIVSPAVAGEVWRATGFEMPESAVYDAGHERIVVSNMVGSPDQADGNGYLSLLGADGKVITQKWVTGLDAPKGMALAGSKLYVADITQLRVVDLETGAFETLAVPGAMFLNDVTADAAGNVYVGDMVSGTIYRFAGGKVESFVTGLAAPNGLWVDGGTLVVAGFGAFEGQTPKEMGTLQAVDLATGAVSAIHGLAPFGFLDGLVKLGDDYVASDYLAGTLLRVAPGQAAELALTMKMGTADIATDGKAVFVPQMLEGEVVKVELE